MMRGASYSEEVMGIGDHVEIQSEGSLPVKVMEGRTPLRPFGKAERY